MKTKQYIEKYQLNKGWNKIHQNDFLQDLTSELIVLLEYNKAEGNLLRFDNSVKAIKSKWDAISNKTPFGLPDGMWRYFFATTIAKMREQMCPKQMQIRREKQRRWEEYKLRKEQREREFWNSMDNVYERLILSFLAISAIPTDAFFVHGT